jgi:thiosulfate dehydrogenase (quinone) large subunit
MHAMRTKRINAKTWTGEDVIVADLKRGIDADTKVVPAVATIEQPARWGVALVFLILGYEWLLSGLDKIFSSNFRSGLAAELQDSVPDNSHGWYVHFLERIVIPHAGSFAVVVEMGEVLVAFGMFLGAALWMGSDRIGERRSRTLRPWVIGALLGSALMTANYYLMAGGSFPWLRPSAPFDEALDIDGLLTFVAMGLIGIEVLAMRGTKIETALPEREQLEPSRP